MSFGTADAAGSLKLYSGLFSKPFQCFPELQIFNFHNKGENVPAFAAAETVKCLPFGGYAERGSLFVVKRAFSPVGLAAFTQNNIVTDDFGNIKSGFDLSDIIASRFL